MRENIKEGFLKAVTSELIFKEPGSVLLAEEGERDGYVGLLRQGWVRGDGDIPGKNQHQPRYEADVESRFMFCHYLFDMLIGHL